METYDTKTRDALLYDWMSRTGSYATVPNFLTNAFGRAGTRWYRPASEPRQTLCDAVVEATVEACLAGDQMELGDYATIIGHNYLSRTEPAFHNYTVAQVQQLVPRIARLWADGTDGELREAMDYQRQDQLLAYFLHLDEGIPLEYALAVTQS